MIFLINIIFAILAFMATRWLCAQIHIPEPIDLIIAVLVALIVFVANFAARVI